MSTGQPPAKATPAAHEALQHTGRPREEDIATRKRMSWWDHAKYLILLAVVWFLLVFSLMGDDPLIGFLDALRLEVGLAWWVFAIAGAEFLHQLHFVISGRWGRYHQFWLHSVWERTERFKNRHFSAWTQFRFWRMVRWVLAIAVVGIIAGKIIHVSPALALLKIPALAWHELPFVVQLVFILFLGVAQFALLFWFLSRGGIDTLMPDEVKTRFSDVWGQDHVLERVKENIIFLEHPELVEDHGGFVPGGILLWGPPGTGKTLMAEAVAGETGRPYVFVDPGAFNNMFFGVGLLKVKGLFRKLRKLALRYGGVIVFFDEADSLGSRGVSIGGLPGSGYDLPAPPLAANGCHGFSYMSQGTQRHLVREALSSLQDPQGDLSSTMTAKQIMGLGMGGAGMGTLQGLLSEISGLTKPRGFFNKHIRKLLGMRPKPPPKYRILIIMATNMVSALDPALLRPGRIDRIYKVGYPSKNGRIRTYQGYFGKVANEVTDEQVDKLATITPYATGASIKDLVNESLITAIRDGRDVVTWQDVLKAKQLKKLGPPEDVEYIERERHAVAVHEACHALVAYRTQQHVEIDIATIEKGGDYLGMVDTIPPEDQFTQWRSEYESDVMVYLASLAGERMFFESDSSSGVSGDLNGATIIASYMEGVWGMGTTISSLVAGKSLGIVAPGGAPGGEQGGQGERKEGNRLDQARRLADRVEDNLVRLLAKAEEILRENEAEVLSIAHALETHKTLSGVDVAAVINGEPGPVVDGTPYANPVFISQLRAYHQAAVRAHHEHNKPSISLPDPEDLPAAIIAADEHLPDPYSVHLAESYSVATGSNGNHPYGGTHHGSVHNGSAPWNKWYKPVDDTVSHGSEEEAEDDVDEPPASH
jgi:cell division protease FtsH